MDLKTLKPGIEVFFIDKSEGPGVVIYIQGNIVAVGENNATLEVTDSGTLIAPGYMAPYEPTYRKGSVVTVTPDNDFEFVTPAQFSQLREEYEVIPQGTEQNDPEPPAVDTDVEEARAEVLKAKERLRTNKDESKKKEFEDDLSRAEEVYRNLSAEEGAPEYEPSDDSLYLTANLKSWGDDPSVAIHWPKGFPQDWMEQIYKDLPEGVAAERGGEPVIRMPGGKGPGIAPDTKVNLEKDFNDASKKAQEAAEALEAAKKAVDAADATGDKELIAKKDEERKKAVENFQKAKNLFLEVKKKIGGEEGAWVRPPDQTTYEQSPGRHMPTDISFGKAGLRQALKQLSNNYKETLNLVDSVDEEEKRADQYQKELDLILRLRKKQVKDVSENPNDPHYVIEKGEKGTYDPARILNLLKKLKEKELRKKPYLFSTDQKKHGDVIIPSERDRVVEDSETKKIFEDRAYTDPESGEKKVSPGKVGGTVSFFDLPPEEVDILIKKEVDRNGPMDSKDVAELAKEYAKEYKEFLEKNTEWKDLSEEIQKYLRSQHSLVVSDEQSDRIEKEIYTKGKGNISVKGHDLQGEVVEISLPVQDFFTDVVKPIVENYEKRVKYLRFLQNNRKNELARQKGALRRMLVEKKEYESELIDESQYKDSIMSLFRNYAKFSHDSKAPEKIPGRYRVHHGLPALEEKNEELKELKVIETDLNIRRKKLEEDLRKSYAPYEKALGDVELLRDDVVYIKDSVEGSGLLEVVDEIDDLSKQIKRLVSQREFASRFPSRGGAQIKEISEGIRSAIEELNAYKITFTKDLPRKYLHKVSDVLMSLRKAINSYESSAKSSEEKIQQINLKLEELRDKKDMVAEEIK